MINVSFKRKEFILIFIYFLVLIITAIATHHTFLGVQDEAQLYATLKNSEPINYMTSYPFALFGGFLYSHFPNMQWYSILMTLYIVFIAALLAWYISLINLKNKILTYLFKLLLLILSTLIIIYMLLEVDVTSPTLILIVLAIPLIRVNQIYFWAIVWIASFLREQIIFSLIPLIALAYLAAISKEAFLNKKRVLISLIFIFGILFNHFSYKLNPTYNKWMEFTEKRAYFTDFGGAPTKDILTADEFHLARTWWIVDQDLYPYKKVMQDAGTTLDIIKQRLNQHSLKSYLIIILRKHQIIYLFFIISILIAIVYKSWIKLFSYMLFGAVFIILLFVKDVERVTLPMYLMWCSMILTDLWFIANKKRVYYYLNILLYPIIIIGLSYTIYHTLPWNRITHFKQREEMVKELKGLLKRNKSMQLEITTGFPSSWEYLIETIMQNHLFDERNWIDYDNDLLLQGWFSRVPLVYKQHNVSFNGVKRKYAHYHDWLIQPTSGILGSKGESKHIRPFLLRNLMRMYDKKFPKKGCYHEPIVVDESEHFVIHRVAQICNLNSIKKDEVWNLFKDKNKKLDSLILTKHMLIAKTNDPKIILSKINNIKSKYILLKVDINVKNSKNNYLQIFYKLKNQKNYNEYQAKTVHFVTGINNIKIILPSFVLKQNLRIDPVSKKGEYKVEDMIIYELDL